MTAITVKQIASAIRRPGEDLAQAVDRVRNWTDEDLLKPSGKKNPGTGKPRVYSETALIDALILTILTDAAGMQAVKGPIGRLFKMMQNGLEFEPDGTPHLAKGDGLAKRVRAANKGPGLSFIMFGFSRDARSPPEVETTNAKNLAAAIGASQHESHVVIDLHKIYLRLNAPENSSDG